ncbi:hypothetical protein KNO15_02870 [Leifsonia shinshuensis]|uniref:hypothetical protein n=1 Tax=Leifsonia shinshuensis TaxID=150026 RepID=UPI001F5088B6|nr:hypothetical protein [Leifsonia shinshuensis]MCI0155636.1 hypothetical protein [Leifsonia shinshuensis]
MRKESPSTLESADDGMEAHDMDRRSAGRRAAVGITTAIGIGSLAVTGILSGLLFAGTTSTTSGTASTGTGSTSSGSGSTGSSSGSSGSSSGTDSGSGVQQSQGGGFSGRSGGS